MRVLFVCVHNAGRSQMAAAIFNKLAREAGLDARAESAGTHPSERVHPNVARAMEEWGVDLWGIRPRTLTDDMAEGASRVITMGCEVDEAACPALFMKGVEDWGLTDPAGKGMDEVRAIRAEIRERVVHLLRESSGASECHGNDS